MTEQSLWMLGLFAIDPDRSALYDVMCKGLEPEGSICYREYNRPSTDNDFRSMIFGSVFGVALNS
ncbi:hypothetical protein [Microcoleus sp. herbarium14]|uniref:hypothetical protein n=1 Tax=Microcoleus sp. herbarium14 TaxID=3055439 RepID=UPI002FCEA01D